MPDNQLIWGAHTKIKYGKELSPRGRECECSQEERSTFITKRLVFPSTRFAIKRAVIEFWSVSFNRMITTFCRRGSVCASLSEASRCCRSGKLEVAQQIANHESPRTTKLYDRRNDEISLDEIERITI
jgi:hypothetical protein